MIFDEYLFFRNGYLYPLESFYEGSIFNTASKANTNLCTNKKQKKNKNSFNQHKNIQQQQLQLQQQHQQQQQQQLQQQQQQQQQQQHHFQLQQQGHFVKLLESSNPNNSSNMTGTLHSNTNHTNSNFFVSPALSAVSNRRHSDGSFLNRFKYRYYFFYTLI
jgi:transcription initiation factor TFIID subunit TAF12